LASWRLICRAGQEKANRLRLFYFFIFSFNQRMASPKDDESESKDATTTNNNNEDFTRYAAYGARLKTIALTARRYLAYTSDFGEALRHVPSLFLV
jgi:hypothetical protein